MKYSNGDPRHFLAELKTDTKKTLWGETQQYVYLHRMPYMKLDKKIQNWVNIILFIMMLIIAASYHLTKSLWDIMITVQTPFDLFIIPACFFYYRYKEKQNTEEGDL